MAGTQKAIIGWRVGKRNADTTLEFLHDLRGRVIGQPEISTDGFLPYRNSIGDAFGDSLTWHHQQDLFGNAPCKGSAGAVLARGCSSCKP